MEAISHENLATSWGKNTYFIVSIILLVAVICVSVFLWFLNSNLEKQISESNLKIIEYTKQVDELKLNNEIAAYDIILENKSDIINSIEKSKAQVYLTEVLNLSKKYKMMFTGFSFNWETISTSADYINKDAKDDAIAWVSNFIKDFRTSDQNMFILKPISSVAWDSLKKSFEVTFEISKTFSTNAKKYDTSITK
ncbi:MAG: hypothetical protein ACD_3C00043G0012 [uncultured bacterium (gcode 4)]|uniref:Uncharacterized protein n=1 Tax=uncultured bacterium (gcode 4) TaxID=1234023 RepID=K2G053_9BACT|nr:MAG: hypothetical protein ACD_3C00043G0012 [uncultured bacterium (gcode 4)]